MSLIYFRIISLILLLLIILLLVIFFILKSRYKSNLFKAQKLIGNSISNLSRKLNSFGINPEGHIGCNINDFDSKDSGIEESYRIFK